MLLLCVVFDFTDIRFYFGASHVATESFKIPDACTYLFIRTVGVIEQFAILRNRDDWLFIIIRRGDNTFSRTIEAVRDDDTRK